MPEANLFRTDIRAWLLVKGKRYPLASVDTMYRISEIPYAFVEVPVGRKLPKDSGSDSNTPPYSNTGELITELNPLDPAAVVLQCTKHGELAKGPQGEIKKLGFLDGAPMTVFSGYVTTPWVRKRRNGRAFLALTLMGQIGKLCASTQYVRTIQSPTNGMDGLLVMALGEPKVGRLALDAAFRALPISPVDDLVEAIKLIFRELATEMHKLRQLPNAAAMPAVNRLYSMFSAKAERDPAAHILSISLPGAQPMFMEALKWNLARHFAETFYSGLSYNDLEEGGGDFWNILHKLSYLLQFGIVSTPGSKDWIFPLYYGLNSTTPWRQIDPSEYWEIEIGKQFPQKDYAYISELQLFSNRCEGTTPGGYTYSRPSVGSAMTAVRGEVAQGRMVLEECPTWAVPYAPGSPKRIGESGPWPDDGAEDDLTVTVETPAEKFTWTKDLGDKIAACSLAMRVFKHRVISLTGRLRWDIAPGSLIRVGFNEDLFTQQKLGSIQYFWGYVAETRSKFGTFGQSSTARTTLVLSHLHSETEHNRFQSPVHPLYNQLWLGGPLVENLDG